MKKPSRVFNDCGFTHPDWDAISRAIRKAEDDFVCELVELYINGTRFLDATSSRRSQNFFLTTPQKLIQSPTHERKI